MPLDERGLYAPADFSALRSLAFDAPRVNSGARALRAALRMPKRDKHGRRYRGRDRSLLGRGHHPAAEAERILLDEADRLGLGHEAVEIEARHWLETEINAGADAPKPCTPCRSTARRAGKDD